MSHSSAQFPVLSSKRSSSQLPVISSQENLAGRGARRWVKFNFVGAIGIPVQLAALTAFRSWMNLDYLLATALAVEAAVIHNFLWHERFTWADRPAARPVQSLARLAKFNASNGGVSIVGNLLLMRLLVGELHLNYVLANLFAIAVCSLANFLLSDRLVFPKQKAGALAGCGKSRLKTAAPKGVVETERFTASLKRCPDTKRQFFRRLLVPW
jgi:putative flippase GtrA